MASVPKLVWVPSKTDAYITAELVSAGDKESVVSIGGEEKKVKTKDTHPINPASQDGVGDNTELMHLHEPGLLHNLACRYKADKIYTYTGNILIAVNPFKRLPIYGEDILLDYVGKSIGVMPPHVYAIADLALRKMKTSGVGQAIIISGESGAGKTETAKVALEYLTSLSGGETDGESLATKMMQSNPILEAFGNAKTTRNNNSSRFGKFMEIEFDELHMICSGKVETYLLEKSRIVQHQQNERSYHSFYQLCAGASPELRTALKLAAAEDYHYTNQSSTTTVEGVDDASDFQELSDAMEHCGFTTDEQHVVYQLLAGILHLGNVTFDADNQDNAELAAPAKAFTEDVSALFGIDLAQLQKNLVTREVKTRNEKFDKPLSVQDAGYVRDALSKAIYGKLFDWLVLRVDDALRSEVTPRSFIGVLDIYGFEFFELNSFEQLCINFANEKLQMHFNQSVFNEEKEMYAREAISVPEVPYKDNQSVIDLIEAKGTGILSVLDEVGRMPRATDKMFCEAVQQKHERDKCLGRPTSHRRKSSSGPAPRSFGPDEAFVVKHFAADVTYCVDGFLDKNQDPLHETSQQMLASSSLELLALLFKPESAPASGGGRSRRKPTVASMFKKQLERLTSDLQKTNSHFIRCVKPNVAKQPHVFDNLKVIDQLQSSGMMEALKLMHEGFPTRCPFNDLYDRYHSLMPPEVANMEPPTFCQFLLTALGLHTDSFRIGLTRVFFRAGQYALIDELTSNEDMLPEIAKRVKNWMVSKTLKKAVYTIAALKLLDKQLTGVRSRAVLQQTFGVAHQITSGIFPAERRARAKLEEDRAMHAKRYQQVQRAAGVMNVAAKGLLPAERRAKEALALQRQQKLEAEAAEARRLQEAEDAERKAAIERENAHEREVREEEERKEEARRQKAREDQLAREQAAAAEQAEAERRRAAAKRVWHRIEQKVASVHALQSAAHRAATAKAEEEQQFHQDLHEQMEAEEEDVLTEIADLKQKQPASRPPRSRMVTGVESLAAPTAETENTENVEVTVICEGRVKFDFRPSADIIRKFKGVHVLTLQAGARIEITDDSGDWWMGRLEGTSECGFFPSNYIKRLKASTSTKAPVEVSWESSKLHLVEVAYDFTPSQQIVDEWALKHKGTSVLSIEVGELIEVTDFSSTDWWTGLKQTVRQDDSTSTNDHHGGRKRLQTQSFAYGVFPANHVKTIMVTPLSPNANLKKGTCVVMQNQASVWRRCRVVEEAGWMSKKLRLHYIGYLPKWDEYLKPDSARISGTCDFVESPAASSDSDESAEYSDSSSDE